MLCDLIKADVDEDVRELTRYNTTKFKEILNRYNEPTLSLQMHAHDDY